MQKRNEDDVTHRREWKTENDSDGVRTVGKKSERGGVRGLRGEREMSELESRGEEEREETENAFDSFEEGKAGEETSFEEEETKEKEEKEAENEGPKTGNSQRGREGRNDQDNTGEENGVEKDREERHEKDGVTGNESGNESENDEFLARLATISSITEARAKVETEHRRKQLIRQAAGQPNIEFIRRLALPSELQYVANTSSSNELPYIYFQRAPFAAVDHFSRLRLKRKQEKRSEAAQARLKISERRRRGAAGGWNNARSGLALEAGASLSKKVTGSSSALSSKHAVVTKRTMEEESKQDQEGALPATRKKSQAVTSAAAAAAAATAAPSYAQSTKSQQGVSSQFKKRSSQRAHVSSCTCPSCKVRRRKAASRPCRLRYRLMGAMSAVLRATMENQKFVFTQRDNW